MTPTVRAQLDRWIIEEDAGNGTFRWIIIEEDAGNGTFRKVPLMEYVERYAAEARADILDRLAAGVRALEQHGHVEGPCGFRAEVLALIEEARK
jgi:hypothetical protein